MFRPAFREQFDWIAQLRDCRWSELADNNDYPLAASRSQVPRERRVASGKKGNLP
jgi:hypothetical protein